MKSKKDSQAKEVQHVLIACRRHDVRFGGLPLVVDSLPSPPVPAEVLQGGRPLPPGGAGGPLRALLPSRPGSAGIRGGVQAEDRRPEGRMCHLLPQEQGGKRMTF